MVRAISRQQLRQLSILSIGVPMGLVAQSKQDWILQLLHTAFSADRWAEVAWHLFRPWRVQAQSQRLTFQFCCFHHQLVPRLLPHFEDLVLVILIRRWSSKFGAILPNGRWVANGGDANVLSAILQVVGLTSGPEGLLRVTFDLPHGVPHVLSNHL
eukprot:CAMPEP_0114641206 /NCGR_PEP_ID=MMETSP0191-20121206/2125_1 /TAXON_ID=126664 /ORGANISM="Sorites sp." /LENGTH=155 /DNA_ID=CAMNT_0001853215 /DNA_START=159 /DNA_END=623 /DNA_ORIENTATION=-